MLEFLASPLRNLLAGIIFMLAVSSAAVAAYVAHGWPIDDAIYMVVLTVYTIGYEEVRPINTPELRAITIGLIVVGCTGMLFVTGAIVQLITLSQFQQFLGVRRMQKDIDRLTGHVIICGYGRIGQTLALDLKAGNTDFVIVDRGEDRLGVARDQGFRTLQGDATDEEILKAAGVARARALATVLPDDATNVFITLSARSLNRDLMIIARGEVPSTERKLLQAGADRVVLPTHIGAERIAELLMYQDVATLLQGAIGTGEKTGRDLRRLGLDLEVVAAATGSRCVGATIGEIETIASGAFLIVALARYEGETILQPQTTVVVQAGDGVAIVGRPGRAQAMQRLFSAPLSL